jgi:glutathione synthase/RimK-type ligase-like ATP-grasp enzyme
VILVVSNAADATASFFEDRLRLRGVDYIRLNTEEADRLAIDFQLIGGGYSGAFSICEGGARYRIDEISAIYYRRPRPVALVPIEDPALRLWMQNEHRRAWGGLLFVSQDVRWVNNPIAVGGASYKPEQLARAVRHGLSVPDSLVTSDPTAAEQFCVERNWRIVVKPIGHGEIRGEVPEADRLVYTNSLQVSHAAMLERVRNCPTLFQVHLAKAVDLRITVAGAECIAVALHSQEREHSLVDCRRDNMLRMRYSITRLPTALADTLVDLTRSYGLYYAAIDMVLDPEGNYWFLELNPAGQWAWLEQEIGAPISDALIRCLTGASV